MVDSDLGNGKNGDGNAANMDANLAADWKGKLADAKAPQRGFPWLGTVGVVVLGFSVLTALKIGSFRFFSFGLVFSTIFFGLQAILRKLDDILDEMKK